MQQRYALTCEAKNRAPREELTVEAESNLEAKTLAAKRYREKHQLASNISVQTMITATEDISRKPLARDALTTLMLAGSIMSSSMDEAVKQLPQIQDLRAAMAEVKPDDILRMRFREGAEGLSGLSMLLALRMFGAIQMDDEMLQRVAEAVERLSWGQITDRKVDVYPVVPQFRKIKEFERIYLFLEDIELLRPQAQ